MNYGLALSLKLEKFLAQLIAEGAEDIDPATGESLEDRAMHMAQEEIYEESGRKWRPWCSNGKSLRVGEIILIIDADTIVPEVRQSSCTLFGKFLLIYMMCIGLF
jgi:hypothetical protein